MNREIIILSGASQYYISYIEIIKNLNKENIWPKNPKILIGSSSGAYLILILSLLKDISLLNENFIETKIVYFLNTLYNIIIKGYLVDSEKLKQIYLKIFKKNFPEYDFENMTFSRLYKITKKFCIINAFDFKTKQNIQFDPFLTPDLKCIDALTASSSLIPLISFYNYNNTSYSDACFYFNLNIEALNSLSVKKLNINTSTNNIIGIYCLINKDYDINLMNLGLINLYINSIYLINIIYYKNYLSFNKNYKKYTNQIIKFQILDLNLFEYIYITNKQKLKLIKLGKEIADKTIETYNKSKGKILSDIE